MPRDICTDNTMRGPPGTPFPSPEGTYTTKIVFSSHAGGPPPGGDRGVVYLHISATGTHTALNISHSSPLQPPSSRSSSCYTTPLPRESHHVPYKLGGIGPLSLRFVVVLPDQSSQQPSGPIVPVHTLMCTPVHVQTARLHTAPHAEQ